MYTQEIKMIPATEDEDRFGPSEGFIYLPNLNVVVCVKNDGTVERWDNNGKTFFGLLS